MGLIALATMVACSATPPPARRRSLCVEQARLSSGSQRVGVRLVFSSPISTLAFSFHLPAGWRVATFADAELLETYDGRLRLMRQMQQLSQVGLQFPQTAPFRHILEVMPITLFLAVHGMTVLTNATGAYTAVTASPKTFT